MKSSLSLPSKLVARVHFGGLRRADPVDYKLSAERVVGIDNISDRALLRPLLDAGALFPLRQSIQDAREHSLSGLTGFAGAVQQMQEAREQSLSGLTGFAGAVQQMQEAREQSLSGLTGFAGAVQQMQEVREQSLSGLTGFAGALQQIRELRGQSLVDVTGFASAVTQMQEIRGQSFTGFAGAVQQMQKIREHSLSGLTETLQALGELDRPFTPHLLATQETTGEIERLLRLSALHYPELATVGPTGRRRSSVRGSPSIILRPKWEEHLQYFIHSLPSFTWQWVRNNPEIVLAILLWLIPPPYQWQSADQSEEEFPVEHDRVIVTNQVEVLSKPSSHSVVMDTLYYNNTVEQIDRDGLWTKVEYRNQVKGQKKRGWVLNHYLDQVE